MSTIVFFCACGSGKNLIATALAQQLASKDVELISAGDPSVKVPLKIRDAAKTAGVSIPESSSYSLQELEKSDIDVLITMCDESRDILPFIPGSAVRIHWDLPDSKDSYGEVIPNFYQVIQEIQCRVEAFFTHGYFESLLNMRRPFRSLLDNLTDGVMAHDLSRKINFFNRAASRITGYSASEVVGRDCHEVFAGKFCGGNCSFCDSPGTLRTKLRYPHTFNHKDGTKRDVVMSVVPIRANNDEVEGAMVIFRDTTEVQELRRLVHSEYSFHGIIGRHPKMVKVFDAIRDLAKVEAPVLIQGESGTGKEMVAYALHALSDRSGSTFSAMNCGALPEGTLESELFGHVEGAFTGAIRDKKGRFELAEGGTLFLDEIGEISPAMQVKLLRVIQERNFVPVGGETTKKVDVRLISATNKDLKTLVKEHIFREDLYYRLAVIPIYLPPLRDRVSDIPLLVQHFLEMMGMETKKAGAMLSPSAMDLLLSYPWPGNIRELRNAIQYGLIQCKGKVVGPEHLPMEIIKGAKKKPELALPGRKPKLNITDVQEALIKAGDNKAKAARILGVSRTTLYRYIEKHRL